MRIMVTRCRFKRMEKSEWELGLCVGPDYGDATVIIDSQGKPVPSEPQIWDYNRQVNEGLIWFDL